MRRPLLRPAPLLAVLVAAVLLTAPRLARTEEPAGERVAPEAVLAEMGWLAGTWRGAMWGGQFEAYYSTPEGGRILGHSTLTKDGKRAFYEFEVFDVAEHVVHMRPFPGGKAVTGFQLASADPAARRAVFENAKKDFPTRIVYHRTSDTKLVITLSDPHGDSDKVEVFDLDRVP